MVLSQETDCVLLDEPLSSLDTEHAVAMMKRLRRIADELGKTIVVVLHDINFTSSCSERIVAMKAGRVMNHGPPPELMTSAVLHDIYELEVRVETLGEHRYLLHLAGQITKGAYRLPSDIDSTLRPSGSRARRTG